MERVIRLTQKWEGHDIGEDVFVHSDTHDLLISADVGKDIDQADEVRLLVARTQEQAQKDAKAAEAAKLDPAKIEKAVDDIVGRERAGAEKPPQLQPKVESKDMGRTRVPKSAELGWHSTAEWWHAAALAARKTQPIIDPRLTDGHINQMAKTTGYHEVGDDSLGGYLVPDDVRAELLRERLENTVVRSNGPRVIPTTKDNVVLAKVDDTTHASTVFGNVVLYWINEQASITVSNLKFGQVQIPVEKLAGMCYVTHELATDAYVSVEAEVSSGFSEGAAWFEDYAFLNGTGAGQPKGVLQSGAKVSVTRAGAGAIAWADIANMYARQRRPGNAVWVANQATLPQLLQMTGGTEVIWIGLSGGATKSPPGSLLGRPIIFTEKVPTLGTAGDLNFIDFSDYVIADRESIRVDRSDDLLFTTDQIALRFILRVGGRNRTNSAFQPKNGSTLSPVVQLN